jgi:hypothetical protein
MDTSFFSFHWSSVNIFLPFTTKLIWPIIRVDFSFREEILVIVKLIGDKLVKISF